MQGKIDHVGMWTWGGRMYNWKRYLNNMHRCGMDTAVLWHDRVPTQAKEIQEYAQARGIHIIWGFNWGWNTPVCLDSEDDAEQWKNTVLKVMRTEYAQLKPYGIYFQLGGTEFGSACRRNCPVCAAASKDGVGQLFLKFSSRIISAIRQEYPGILISAGVHLGGIHRSYAVLRELPAAIQIMWEDIPGPGHHIEVPFAYDWDDESSALTTESINMVRSICSLRGREENVAFVVKGFPCHWGGDDPMLLEEFDLKALAAVYQTKWDKAAKYCERRLNDALQVFRIIADSPAREKSVVLLVEHGLWELHCEYAAVLINEAIRNPFREAHEVLAAARAMAASLQSTVSTEHLSDSPPANV